MSSVKTGYCSIVDLQTSEQKNKKNPQANWCADVHFCEDNLYQVEAATSTEILIHLKSSK